MNIKDQSRYYLKRILKQKTLQSIRERDDDISYKQFDEHQCIFVHIPKNAGISVAKSLLGKRIGHLSALDYQAIFGKEIFNKYFKFTFVRNPFTRLISAYEFMLNGGYGKVDEDIVTIVKQYSSLKDFVMEYLTPAKANAIRHFRPQHYFICDSDDRLMINYLGRFENLKKDYEYIKGKIGTGESLKKMNVTKTGKLPLDEYYPNNETIQKVISIYKKDFELFEYPKEICGMP